MKLNHSKPQRRNNLKLTLMVLMLMLIASAELAVLVGAQDILFFSRSADIGEDRVWIVDEFNEGEFKLDLSVARWDADAKRWTECRTGTSCNNSNAEKLAWGMPVYSPVDGKIKTCWRGFPDNPKPTEKLAGVGSLIFNGGNHVNIETAQGNVILLAHLKQNSIPEKLCPNRSGLFSNADKRIGDYPEAAFIPIASRPIVRRGEFIGLAGNSGNSDNPHIHIEQQPKATDTTEGPPIALKFIQGWAQSYSKTQPASETWSPLKRTAITSSDGDTMFHPSPFLRRGSIGAGPVFDVDLTFIPTTSLAVTAVSDEQRNLKLISWFASNKEFARRDETTAGRVKELKMARIGFNVVVGVRDENNDLKLILYSVTNTGKFLRRTDASAGLISRLSMTMIGGPNARLVTAVRDASGNLKLIAWNIAQSGNAIERLGQATAGPIADVAVAEAKNFPGVITAVRGQNGNLKVIPWRISPDGRTIARGADAEAGFVGSQISVVAIQEAAVVAARDGEGKLRLIAFQLSSLGNIVARRDTEIAGEISAVDIDTTPQSGANIVTTVRDGTGSLRLIAWSCDPRGHNLRRGSASAAGDVGMFSAVGARRSDTDVILTAMKDGQGNLKLIYWDANLNP